MVIGFWVLLVFLLVYEPIIGYFDFQKFLKKVVIDDGARVRYYVNSIIGLWMPTLFILLLILFTDLTMGQIGLSIPNINTELLGPWVTYVGLGLGSLSLLFILYYILGYHFSEKMKKQLTDKKTKEWENSSISVMLPVSKKEKKLWNYVSLTAGITEEIIYRGFLIYALTYLFPELSIWVVIVVASLIFGLAHTYQGFIVGVTRTAIVGVIFSILYIGLDSILPLILLHFLLDYIVKLGDENKQAQDS
ncbi:hypothetical protein GCM10008967_32990 [Bacillus carboniphilus]|uniref:CAAX prenyl protease 2/Lysostaphin resistance protein A-like domain-containing protein n=1 Tax=Bacillus carboniphilus TaxID=86663 RepID=A0ABP3G9D5_9BACI